MKQWFSVGLVSDPLRVLDLFAGAGGLSNGFTSTGMFVTHTAVESDVAAATTFAVNHPATAVHQEDIAAWLRGSTPPAVDAVVGGPPCQGFSNLGNRKVRDPRNALWRRYVDVLSSVRPQVFVLENVADFLKSGQFRDLRRETHRNGRLSAYRIEAGVLRASDLGSAQARSRAVVIGSLRSVAPIGLPAADPAFLATPRTVRDAIGDLAEPLGIDLPERFVSRTPRPIPGPFLSTELHLGRRPTPLSLERFRHIPPGGNRKDLPDHLLAPCWQKHSSGSGDVMGRLHWDRPSVTIRTEFWKPEKGRYLHPTSNRPITHFEASRLQGFPDNYKWCGSKTEIGRQIGNAVPFELARAIAIQIATRFDPARPPALELQDHLA